MSKLVSNISYRCSRLHWREVVADEEDLDVFLVLLPARVTELRAGQHHVAGLAVFSVVDLTAGAELELVAPGSDHEELAREGVQQDPAEESWTEQKALGVPIVLT